VYVELPAVGLRAAADASVAEIESTKSVSEVYCPLSGTVVEVNGELEGAPEAINEDPYGRGWIFTVEVADASELDRLMDAAQYEAFLAS
jgi:glycine cleavage system H protein